MEDIFDPSPGIAFIAVYTRIIYLYAANSSQSRHSEGQSGGEKSKSDL